MFSGARTRGNIMPKTDPEHRPPAWTTGIPNALTLLRIAIAAWFPWSPEPWRLGLVAVAAASDFLDGWIARRFRLGSRLGAILDGIADKAITLSVLLTFTIQGELAWWELVLVMARDIAVIAIAAHLAWHRAWPEFSRMSARMPGKVTTFALFALMGVLLLAPRYAWVPLWPTVLLSVLAAVDYVLIFLSVEVKGRD